MLTVPPTKAFLLCATPAGMDLYIQLHARRHLPSAVPWISEDRLFIDMTRICRTERTPEPSGTARRKTSNTVADGTEGKMGGGGGGGSGLNC